MKKIYLLLISFLIALPIFYLNRPIYISPKYSKNDEVTYVVPRFYWDVCGGEGVVVYIDCLNGKPTKDSECERTDGQNIFYHIQIPSNEKNCPSEMIMQEKDVIARTVIL